MNDFIGTERYRFVSKLGSGGFGETYLVQDLHRPSHPLVVIKKLKGRINDPNVEKDFKREAEALYKLGENHPFIPKLIESFPKEDSFFLVQEYIDGSTLAVYFSKKQLWSETQVIGLLREVLEILSFVHRRGIIHRDVKPQNIIIRKSDKKCCLIDFGAVKRIETVNQSRVIGTPGYIAPEHEQGNPNPQSDIYSLGVIGIQALTGLEPHEIQSDQTWRNRASASPALIQILDRMVNHNYKKRPSAQETLNLLNGAFNSSNTHKTQVIARYNQEENRQKTPLWVYCTVVFAGFVFAYLIRILTVSPNKLPQPDPPITPAPSPSVELPEESLPSDIKGISYLDLKNFLSNGDWENAEQETEKLILQMFGMSSGKLASEQIAIFPCTDLRTIDQLWTQYSNIAMDTLE